MRTIKFRGKDLDGIWRFGDLLHCEKNFRKFYEILHWTEEPFKNEVAPETIGQFTGLQDSKGNDIYEGDNLRNNDTNEIYEILWDEDYLTFAYRKIGSSQNYALYTIARLLKHCTIIGNIYDNPELLKGGEK